MICQFKEEINGFTAFLEHDKILFRSWGITKEKAKESLLTEIKFNSNQSISVLLESHNNSSNSADEHLLNIPFHTYELIQNALNQGKTQVENLDHLL